MSDFIAGFVISASILTAVVALAIAVYVTFFGEH